MKSNKAESIKIVHWNSVLW